MSQRVFLHVGLPKSGTTFVQAALEENKPALISRAGLLYPGEDWTRQVAAVRDLREMPVLNQRREVQGAWQELVDEINAWSGDAVVSMEWLCRCEPDQIRRILDDLRPAVVEAVFTVRDLGRTIPAAWQESVQNRHVWGWDEFLDGVSADEPYSTRAGRRFWLLHDAVRMLGEWRKVLPAEQTHVITVPPTGRPRDLLWQRFCQVLGIDPSGYVVEGLGGNVSLGLDSVEMLRRLNPRARDNRISRTVHKALITQGMAKQGLALREQGPRLVVPPEHHAWLSQRAEEEIRGIEAAEVQVIGDLAELRPVLAEEPGPRPEDVSVPQLLDVALDGLAILVKQWDLETRREVRELRQTVAELESTLEDLNRKNARLEKRSARLRRSNAESRRRLQHLESRPVRSALGVLRRRRRRAAPGKGRAN